MRPWGVSLSHHPPSLPLSGQQAAAQTPRGVQQGGGEQMLNSLLNTELLFAFYLWPLLHRAVGLIHTGHTGV